MNPLRQILLALCCAVTAFAAHSESIKQLVTIPVDTSIAVSTTADLTSKKARKGDQLALQVAEDVVIDGVVVIKKGTAAVGRIGLARDTGAFGQSGKLEIEPLFIQMANAVVRLKGGASEKGSIEAPAAVGLLILTPGFTGRSAKIPAGTRIPARVLRAVTVPAF